MSTAPLSRARSCAAEGAQALRAGVLGASGTSGAELVRLLEDHPRVRLGFATSRRDAGLRLDEIDPAAPPVRLCDPEEAAGVEVDVVFLCVPHGTAGDLAVEVAERGVRVIDLSGDHRLADAAVHDRVYGSPRSEALAAEAVYGLTELAGDRLEGCRFVANPGCYATAMGLALAPLAAAGLLRSVPVVDAKSGVSGAGRVPTATSHFCSASEDVRPYKPGRAHRHVAEVEQLLDRSGPGSEHRILFTPHLVPVDRGIQATIVLQGVPDGEAAVRETLGRQYAASPFVRVLEPGREARIRGVARTNRAHIGVAPVEGLPATIVTVAIDNLLKGAAGQAVQNMNRMFGEPETTGLPGAAPAQDPSEETE